MKGVLKYKCPYDIINLINIGGNVMQGISVDFKGLSPFVEEYELKLMENGIFSAHNMINDKTGAGRNMLRLGRSSK